MILQNTLLVIYLSLALLFSSLARGVAIPSTSKVVGQYDYELESHQSSHQSPSYSRPGESTTNEHPLINESTKRAAYYFPETVPDASELADRLTSMREAGFVPSSAGQQHHQYQQERFQSTPAGSSPPNPEIDSNTKLITGKAVHASKVVSEVRADMWNAACTVAELPLPPLGLFIFASGIVCVATVVSKLRPATIE